VAAYTPQNRATLENPEPCVRRKSVPGSKFAAFWRIFVPGSNLPLRETPPRIEKPVERLGNASDLVAGRPLQPPPLSTAGLS